MKVAQVTIARCPGYFGDALAALTLSPARQPYESVTEPERLNILAARHSSTGEQLLQVPKRNAHFSRDFRRTEIWVCKVFLNDVANTLKEPVAVWRYRHAVCRPEERADQIVHNVVNLGLAFSKDRPVPHGLKQVAKQQRRQTIRPTYSNLGLET
jgi:hypothetical protein